MPSNPLVGHLPGFVWDTRMRGGRYREVLADGRLGKLVAQKTIAADLRNIHDLSAARFGNLAADVVNGALTPAQFQLAMRAELKDLYNANSALARGGWSHMDAAAWERNEQILRGEYGFLNGFAQDLADGKLSPAQAAARAKQYAGKAYSRYWAEDQAQKQAAGYTEERWDDTGDERECAECAALAAQGWVPIGAHGTVPGAGDTDCGGNCRCELTYR